MPAHRIAQIEWHDPAKATEYRERLGPTLAPYGGRTVYAGEPLVLEGKWYPGRAVLVEFPNMAALRRWYSSKEYAPPITLRNEGSTANLIAIEGTPPGRS
ncbi:MAG: DUF1330 domain-containing protein [Thermoplasmata archaeon]